MKLQTRHYDEPDERRPFENGTFERVTLGGTAFGRARYEPRWTHLLGAGYYAAGHNEL